MTSPAFEAFLARIFVEEEARRCFLADPRGEASRAGLTKAECAALEAIDRAGLELASRSFGRKRAQRARQPAKTRSLLGRVVVLIRSGLRRLAAQFLRRALAVERNDLERPAQRQG